MKPTLLFRFVTPLVNLFICVVILTTLGQPSSVLAKKTASRSLTILPLLPMGNELCVGEMVHFDFTVFSGMVPTPGVNVKVNDMALKTNWKGDVYWDQKFESAGEQTFAISASKKGYDSTATKLTYQVTECSWSIGVTYFEDLIEENIWQWQGSIESDHELFALDGNSKLTLLRGSSFNAEYHSIAMAAVLPLVCEMKPEVEGVYSIQFNGELNNGLMKIELSAPPIAMPAKVSMECSCVVLTSCTVKPFPYTMVPNVDLIKSARIDHLVFDKQGGVRRFKLSHLLFWPRNNPAWAQGLVVVTKQK